MQGIPDVHASGPSDLHLISEVPTVGGPSATDRE